MMVGMFFLWLSNHPMQFNGFDISAALSMFGSFLFIAAVIGFYFENFAKFQMFEDVFQRVVGSSSAFNAGVFEHYQDSKSIDYSGCIRKSSSLTTFFTYSDGFIKRYREDIEALINSGKSVKMYFLDEESELIQLMKRKGWSSKSIEANYTYLREFEETFRSKKNLNIVYCDAFPRYSAIIFDSELFIVEQTVSVGQRSVPAMKIDGRGYLADFYRDDLKRLSTK